MKARIRHRRIALATALTLSIAIITAGPLANAALAPTMGGAITDPTLCPGPSNTAYSPQSDPYSPTAIAREIGAYSYYSHYIFGQGVDVALIDSGVAPVPGFLPGAIKKGPDLSFEARTIYAHSDTYGHGTHQAAIINGLGLGGFIGIAPLSRIIDVRVADALGAVDASQMLAAIDWVVQHKDDDGMHIRVLNLSFGVDTGVDWRSDVLTYAAEQAWKAGIVVVVAAGNGGADTDGLTSPATNPSLLTVGSYDTSGTIGNHADDFASGFTSSGGDGSNPSLAAPGEHVMSYHVPGAYLDEEIAHACEQAIADTGSYTSPIAGAGDVFVRGSGTSQATAIVSGAVALMLSARPDLSPNAVLGILRDTSRELANAPKLATSGEGAIDLDAAYPLAAPNHSVKSYNAALGTGTVTQARGYDSLPCLNWRSIWANKGGLVASVATYTGSGYTWVNTWAGGLCSAYMNAGATLGSDAVSEVDVFGNPIDSARRQTLERNRAAWVKVPAGCGSISLPCTGESWLGNPAGKVAPQLSADASGLLALNTAQWQNDWTGSRWSDFNWSGHTWTGSRWSGSRWSGHTWSGSRWSSDALSASRWSGSRWSGSRWSGNTWRDAVWG